MVRKPVKDLLQMNINCLATLRRMRPNLFFSSPFPLCYPVLCHILARIPPFPLSLDFWDHNLHYEWPLLLSCCLTVALYVLVEDFPFSSSPIAKLALSSTTSSSSAIATGALGSWLSVSIVDMVVGSRLVMKRGDIDNQAHVPASNYFWATRVTSMFVQVGKIVNVIFCMILLLRHQKLLRCLEQDRSVDVCRK